MLFSRHGHLLEGYGLARRTPFETVLRAPLICRVDKPSASAVVELPAIIPNLNFFPRTPYPYFRVVASLGVVPDLHYAPYGYTPEPPAGRYLPHVAETEWTG